MKKIIIICTVLFIITGCSKEYLSIRPDKKLRVPSTIEDFEALLNNVEVHNYGTPSLGEVSSDDFYLTDNQWDVLLYPSEKNSYLWMEDIFSGLPALISSGWYHPYQQILYANMVLDGIKENNIDQNKMDELRSKALFYRSWAFFQLSQLFAYPLFEPYINQSKGVPLKLNSDINFKSNRPTVKEVYELLIDNLNESLINLPESSEYKTIPTKRSAHGLLSKIYLQTGQYEKALEHADICFSSYNQLLDYNLFNANLNFPFSRLNEEVIFHSSMAATQIFSQSSFLVNPELYELYEDADLRKTLFYFKDNLGIRYKGSYNGDQLFFGGIALDEILLIRAECNVRVGNLKNALADLNELLKRRYKKGEFKEFHTDNSKQLLEKIKIERRKELVFRGIRWHDLRRFNFPALNDESFQITRELKGITYILEPNSPKYVLPIPPDVIIMSGMEQNPR